MYLLLPLLTLGTMFLSYTWKVKRFGIVSLLFATYLTMCLTGVLLFSFDIILPEKSISLAAMLYFSFCLCLVFSGFMQYSERRVERIFVGNSFILQALENILLVGSFFAIIFFAPFAVDAITGDVLDNRLAVTSTLVDDSVTFPMAKYGIINSFASLFANLFIVTQMFFFLNLVSHNGRKKNVRAILMLLGSFSYVIYILSYVGRDGVVYWCMTFLAQYLFFKDFIAPSTKTKIRNFFLLIIPILLIPFLIISIARFNDSPLGFYLALFDYLGQQSINFSDHFQVDAPLKMGDLNFPGFVGIWQSLGLPFERISYDDYNDYFLKEGIYPWVFTTFIGTFFQDFGKFGAVVVLSGFFYLIRRCVALINRARYISIENYILFILYFQVVYWGVFYFRLYSGNYYIIAMVLLHFVIRMTKSQRNYFLFKPLEYYKDISS